MLSYSRSRFFLGVGPFGRLAAATAVAAAVIYIYGTSEGVHVLLHAGSPSICMAVRLVQDLELKTAWDFQSSASLYFRSILQTGHKSRRKSLERRYILFLSKDIRFFVCEYKPSYIIKVENGAQISAQLS